MAKLIIVNSFNIDEISYFMDNTNCLHVFETDTDKKIGCYAPNTCLWQNVVDEAISYGIEVFA